MSGLVLVVTVSIPIFDVAMSGYCCCEGVFAVPLSRYFNTAVVSDLLFLQFVAVAVNGFYCYDSGFSLFISRFFHYLTQSLY